MLTRQPRLVLRFLTGGLIAGFVVWCIVSLRADLAQISFQPIRRAWNVVLIALSFSVLNYTLRAIRWRWYLQRLGYRLAPGFSALVYVAGFAFTLSPGKLGEVIRYRYYNGISLSEVTTVVFVERLLDMFAMLVLGSLAIMAFPDYIGFIGATAVAIVATLALLALLPWKEISRYLPTASIEPTALVKASSAVAGALANAHSLLRPQSVTIGFLISLVAWGLEGVGLGVLSRMVEPSHLDMPLAIGIYAIATLAGALSFVPGGLGSTEAMMTALLAARGYAVADALLIALACRVVTLWFAVGLGWLAVFVLRKRLS